MFENILTKESVSFKDLEQIRFKIYLLSNQLFASCCDFTEKSSPDCFLLS